MNNTQNKNMQIRQQFQYQMRYINQYQNQQLQLVQINIFVQHISNKQTQVCSHKMH